jgi:hypothetical protein
VWKIAGSAAFIFIVFRFLRLQPLDAAGILVKLVLVIAYGTALVFLNVIDSKEIAEVKTIFRRLFVH